MRPARILPSSISGITLEEALELTRRFITPKSRIPLITAIPDRRSKLLRPELQQS